MIKLRRSDLRAMPKSVADTVTLQHGEVSVSNPIDFDDADLVLPEAYRDATMSLDSWAR